MLFFRLVQPNDTIAITDDTPSTSTPPTLPSPPTAMSEIIIVLALMHNALTYMLLQADITC